MSNGRYSDDLLEDSLFRDDEKNIQEELEQELIQNSNNNQSGGLVQYRIRIMGITKTDFMRGMQCQKMLWLDKHKPDLKVISKEVQQRLDAGNDFGDREMFNFLCLKY